MEIFASIAIKTWRKHRHRNTLSYYQLGVGTETQEAVHETPRVRKVHPAVSTHEIYRAPPPPLPLPCQSSVLDLNDWWVSPESGRGTSRDSNILEIGGQMAGR